MPMRPDRRHRPQRGVAIVEFALILPLLLMLCLASAEIGRAVMHYNVLAQSVRQAARYLSTQTPGQGWDVAQQIILYGQPGGSQLQLPFLSQGQVMERSYLTQGSNPQVLMLRVAVRGYTYQPMFSALMGLPFGPITFSDISASLRVESCGSLC